MAKGDLIFRAVAEADFDDLMREATELQTILNKVGRSAADFREELEQQAKGQLEYRLVVNSEFNDKGIKEAKISVVTVNKEYENLLNTIKKIETAPMKGSVTSLRQQVNEAKQARDAMVKYASSADGISGKLSTINVAWAAQNQRVKDLQKELDIASASNIWQKLAAEYNLKGLAGAGRQITELVNVFQSLSIVAGQVIGSVNQLFDTLQKLQSIKLTFEGIGAGGDVGKVFSESSRIALGLGVNLNTVRDAFQQLSPVILATGGNIGDVSAVAESLSSRFITFGLSADKSRRVMNGVVQAFSKGKLMAEELTQQISEADPAFRTDLAEAVGVSVKELGEMVKAGEITNQVLLEAIPRMSKASGLFGKLGTSAIDAARGLREGNVTVEQFRAQLGNLEQLAIEDLINPDTGPLQPFLASLAELRAVVTDLATGFAGSEIFKTFLTILGQVTSQVSIVVQAIASIGSAFGSIIGGIFAVINTIDSLGGLLKGFGIISTTVAAIITTKLVASLVTLGAGAIVGTATAAINGLTAALTLLSAKGIAGVANNVATAIVKLLGLAGAATASTTAQGAATAATGARAAATAFLSKVLGIQAAKEALVAAASGAAATAQVKTAGGIVITGAAAATATPAVGGLATATTGLAAAASAALAFLVPIGIALAAIGAGYVFYNTVIKDGVKLTGDFNQKLANIQTTAKETEQAIVNSAKGIDEYTAKIAALDKQVKEIQSRPKLAIDFIAKGGGSQDTLDVLETANINNLTNAAKEIGAKVKKEIDVAIKSVGEYSEALDKSGTVGQVAAAKILAAENTVNAALDLTKAKRDELIAQAEKDIGEGKAVSQERIEGIRLYDLEIKKLEEQKAKIREVRQEARSKNIPIPVTVDIKDAEERLKGFADKTKGLEAQVILETNPEKRAKLQSELNGLKAYLDFLKKDRTEVLIEAKFKIDQRTFKDAEDLSRATLDNMKTAVDLGDAFFNLEKGKVSGKEVDVNTELDAIRERLDGEKDIRKERMQAAEEAGASESTLNRLKKADRDAERAAQKEIQAKEEELKQLAEQKRQLEIQAINAKIAALPAQQAAEREALKNQQELVRLELERTAAAATRARTEQQLALAKTGDELSEAREDKDTAKVNELTQKYNDQLKLLETFKAEEQSLQRSLAVRERLDQLQQQTLSNQQQAQLLNLQAEAAALGAATGQTQISQATQATAVAGSNVVSNAQTLAQLSRDALQYQQSGAAAARAEADAKGEALRVTQDANAAASSGANQVRTDTEEVTEAATEAAAAATLFGENLGGAATALKDGTTPAMTVAGSLEAGKTAAQGIADNLNNIDRNIDVRVNYVGQQGLWTGGPTVGGQTYRINELGQEGFLSSTGTLSAINKPRNALWKAPGKGMVIPAHIMSNLDIPTGRVSTGVRPGATGTGGNGMSRIVRAIQNALMQPSRSDPGLQEMASVQAHQAQQIGKLSRAVNKLADKDWNVNVGVRNTGSTAYLDALNRRM